MWLYRPRDPASAETKHRNVTSRFLAGRKVDKQRGQPYAWWQVCFSPDCEQARLPRDLKHIKRRGLRTYRALEVSDNHPGVSFYEVDGGGVEGGKRRVVRGRIEYGGKQDT